MGVFEEGAKTLGGVFEALKSTPMTLAVVLMNFALLAFLFWNNSEILKQREEITKSLTAYQMDINTKLAECSPKEVTAELIQLLKDLQRQQSKP